MKEQDELVGIIEEEVKKSNLVDPGLVELGLIKKNAPIMDRREFLEYSAGKVGQFLATLAGLGYLTQSTASCAPIGASIRMHADKDWELHLLKQPDLIRGPPLLLHPSTGLPSDFDHHIKQGWNLGFGAVDYGVPTGTPIVPSANSYSLLVDIGPGFNQQLLLLHGNGFYTTYVHLDGYTEIINQGKEVTRTSRATGRTYLFRDQNINKSKIIGFSGNTGTGPGGGVQPQHLHFEIKKNLPGERFSLDPFELGIDAESQLDEYISSTGRKRAARPVYWDAKTAIYGPKDRAKGLQQSLNTLDKRIRESELDKGTKDEILSRHNNPIGLRDYLGMRVLQKKRDKDGNLVYEFKPGSLMYALMLEFYTRTSNQEFIAMLPFIYPELKHIYQKANPPNVKL